MGVDCGVPYYLCKVLVALLILKFYVNNAYIVCPWSSIPNSAAKLKACALQNLRIQKNLKMNHFAHIRQNLKSLISKRIYLYKVSWYVKS